ncbi:MAG: class I SAM-dependent methyltransferase [Cytophagia bacterium]|jgi:SAM-dependent methyltransferase|nr:class I SAM-dependent methyltransferase [Cytophagia bacterium]
MKSKARQECEDAVKQFADHINQKLSLSTGNLLYVGIAGDPPGGEYSPMFSKFNIKTFDIGEKWKPDILGDITKTDFKDNSWDVIVCVQTIEHIPNIWDLPKEISRILKPGGYAIIDCPWMYPYHGEPEFGDYWRMSKDGMKALFNNHLKLVGLHEGEQNTSCLFKK